MGSRERTVATLSALIFSVVGNLCQLYSGKPVTFDLGRRALTPEELGLQVAEQLQSFVSNLTCPTAFQSPAASCGTCEEPPTGRVDLSRWRPRAEWPLWRTRR